MPKRHDITANSALTAGLARSKSIVSNAENGSAIRPIPLASAIIAALVVRRNIASSVESGLTNIPLAGASTLRTPYVSNNRNDM